MRLILLLLLSGAPLAGQFSGLATDDSGTRVWFSSPLRLRTIDSTTYTKVFSADAQGSVSLVAHAEPYDLLRTEASGDGSLTAFLGQPGCHWRGVGCQYLYSFMTARPPSSEDGWTHLSRNGRYALRENYGYDGPTGQIELIDLASGHRTAIAVGNYHALAGGGRKVAADGSVIVRAEDRLWHIHPDGSAESASSDPVVRAALDDSGNRIVYQLESPVCFVSSSDQQRALIRSAEPCALESLSSDGNTALIVQRAQAWLLDTVSGDIRPVTQEAAGVTEATLSGDGRVVWAVTLDGRLLRIDITSGTTHEIIPRTPFLDQPPDTVLPVIEPLYSAPGSLVHLPGRGLASRAVTSGIPLATTLDGVQLLLDGQPVPLVSVSPSEIAFQVPWGASISPQPPAANHTLAVADAKSSPFELNSRNLLVFPRVSPAYWPNPDGSASILHQDFRGTVTRRDPARPGEILHLYVTGLGSVYPAVADGQPAPATPLSMADLPVTVPWWPNAPFSLPGIPKAEVLFEGLAPGMVGVYQLDVRVPADSPMEIQLWGAVIWVR